MTAVPGILQNVELFPCSGGMAEGFRRAGITFRWAFERDDDACDSYENNLGHRPIQMDVRDLLRMMRDGWKPGWIDLLVADPPCTPWSRAGKRQGTADARDMLRETCELISWLRPRAYLIGNVPGLQDLTSWPVVQEVIGRGLSKNGYCVADYAQLDAADYGVPQHRIRPFWFGHRDGPCIRWPAPTHCDPALLAQTTLPGCALLPWVTCREALGHLPAAELGRPVRLRKQHGNGKYWSEADAPALTVLANESAKGGHWLAPKRAKTNHRPTEPDEPAKTLTRNTHSDGALLRTNVKHPINRPEKPSYAVTTKGDGRGAQGACVLEWPWNRPATTIARDERIPPPGHHDAYSIQSHPNAIVLSERAAAILQGFPEDWLFSGDTKRARWSQIGQAMPPPLAHAVATSVVAQMARARREKAA
jgi:DNA (cytosine-5)-methyltransferase 1